MTSVPTTAERFRAFAESATRGGSPLYADWALGFASDDDLLALVDRARASQRQPVLVFAVCRILGAPLEPFPELRAWIAAHSDDVLAELDRRLTQTNDVRRVGPVAVALARIDGPVALLEVGAAAGLGLHPDRFSITVDQDPGGRVVLGDLVSEVRLATAVAGALLLADAALPAVVHRAGLDLTPLDVRSPRDTEWLETLLWPGQTDRVALLRSAIAVAAQDPGALVTGDAVDGLDALLATVPTGAVPVVVTAGTLVYLPGRRRQEFVDRVTASAARWISYERTGVLAGIHATLPHPDANDLGFATLALDGRALATGDAHGLGLVAV